jgi:hypothetical protein
MGGVELLSLDLDGNDYWVGECLDFTGIQIIVVEYNPLFGHLYPVTIPRDDHFDRSSAHFSWLYYGSSLRAWLYLLSDRGFTFLGTNRVGNNAFFCPSDRLNDFPLNAPDVRDLSRFVDWRVREGRDEDGNLSFENSDNCIAEIANLPLVNVQTGEVVSVSFANGI